ncbi:endonuclease/exonuclease/phosphatase family protein [Corynebacterium tapiri]|uniref:Endonuclease/exonuclease/phosphatase family protein n=1 Tax=Corynebacterium tapiri TaxID=1448266 RepID=A0A5C4U5H1_9CORY|nr:endonuclease/exonuclease/phosphatase family protein [Corynebacterium tapiri]TNL99439.1 endonuclease/exonuclease/phosphatase family protein [Corynebacterium tapiri]
MSSLIAPGLASLLALSSLQPADMDQTTFATYNTSLNRPSAGQLITDLSTPDDAQAQAIATVIQHTRPDVIVLNEFDYDAGGEAVANFQRNYLEKSQAGHEPIHYEYTFIAPVNTGVDSGLDLDGNGKLGDPGDAWGFGTHPGQYGMVILSTKPIDTTSARTFQNLTWNSMPNNRLPYEFYGENADKLRLSSKSHWDVPVTVDGRTVHLLVSHPTPPSFDGPEKRNKLRNADEIRLTADYIAGGERADWIVDDNGQRGGLAPGSDFVVFGDQNSDPNDGDNSGDTGINQILNLPQVHDPQPTSSGAQAAGNTGHVTDPALDTADFPEPSPGNLRVDYVLPSTSLNVVDTGVFWPAEGEPLAELMTAEKTSDHHLVWATITG